VRQNDCGRSALDGWCYWTLRREGKSVREATAMLDGVTVAEKSELLHARGVSFAKVPAWQRRGAAISWATFEKEGVDPRSGKRTRTTRRRSSSTTSCR
jgi:tRNA(His) 5'-end guanylyltransferase